MCIYHYFKGTSTNTQTIIKHPETPQLTKKIFKEEIEYIAFIGQLKLLPIELPSFELEKGEYNEFNLSKLRTSFI